MLMSTEGIGQPRALQAAERLRQINPNVRVTTVEENIYANNAEQLVGQADLVVSAAPLFEERLAMNAAAVRLHKPVIHSAMYDLEASVLVTLPGQTACLSCITPAPPAWWRREFPVFGAVAGTAGAFAAMEAIKLIAGLGTSSAGKLWAVDFRNGGTRQLAVARDPECPVCGSR
jgi:molybdopterin/thiamine biosynthesis adenylyltransferase